MDIKHVKGDMKISKQKIKGIIPLFLLIVVFAFLICAVSAADNNTTANNTLNNSQSDGTYKVTINTINDKKPIGDTVAVPPGEVKISFTAYHKLMGQWFIYPRSYVQITIYSSEGGYTTDPPIVLQELVQTNLLGKASVTYDASKAFHGEFFDIDPVVNVRGVQVNPSDIRSFIIEDEISLNEELGESIPNNEVSQNSTSNESASAQTVPMQDTGTPIGMLVLSVLAVIGGLVYTKK